ncbi:hypothetical protein [Micromonospora sp. WMMD812]|uniref:hypothetical protein n=1 Tax=Micromonospora sp. WMMD812 TaxID=3015152 RepID=UPI00248C6281|nr:hypothetical protein [Micromonospora sp. WMMD812]WBB65467.1 hypothetical protein O7603_19925 [Micromonospora sp. WMMD812]
MTSSTEVAAGARRRWTTAVVGVLLLASPAALWPAGPGLAAPRPPAALQPAGGAAPPAALAAAGPRVPPVLRAARSGPVAAAPSPGPEVAVRVGVSIGPRPGGSPTPTGSASPTPTGSVSPTAPGGGPGPGQGGNLPRTGVALWAVLLAGAALVGAGAGLRWAARRRATAERWLAATGPHRS